MRDEHDFSEAGWGPVVELLSPPGNRLEAVISRINRQWRIVFRWRAAEAREVRIVDYHRG